MSTDPQEEKPLSGTIETDFPPEDIKLLSVLSNSEPCTFEYDGGAETNRVAVRGTVTIVASIASTGANW